MNRSDILLLMSGLFFISVQHAFIVVITLKEAAYLCVDQFVC